MPFLKVKIKVVTDTKVLDLRTSYRTKLVGSFGPVAFRIFPLFGFVHSASADVIHFRLM